MSGRSIVIALVSLCLAAAAGSVWYRRQSQPRYVQDLADEALRPQAFAGLLRANGLWGLAQEAVHDPARHGASSPYLRARDASGRVWHVVQASVASKEAVRAASFVFDDSGKLAHVAEKSRAILLDGGGGIAALVRTLNDGGAAVHSVETIGLELREALRVRGSFRLETSAGFVEAGAWELVSPDSATGTVDAAESADPAVFRYDKAAACFRGPAGGPGAAWWVDQEHSGSYCR